MVTVINGAMGILRHVIVNPADTDGIRPVVALVEMDNPPLGVEV